MQNLELHAEPSATVKASMHLAPETDTSGLKPKRFKSGCMISALKHLVLAMCLGYDAHWDRVGSMCSDNGLKPSSDVQKKSVCHNMVGTVLTRYAMTKQNLLLPVPGKVSITAQRGPTKKSSTKPENSQAPAFLKP